MANSLAAGLLGLYSLRSAPASTVGCPLGGHWWGWNSPPLFNEAWGVLRVQSLEATGHTEAMAI